MGEGGEGGEGGGGRGYQARAQCQSVKYTLRLLPAPRITRTSLAGHINRMP